MQSVLWTGPSHMSDDWLKPQWCEQSTLGIRTPDTDSQHPNANIGRYYDFVGVGDTD